MMDRNREARRAAAMTNGLPRRRHRTTTGGSLRESPEDEGPSELQETPARLRDRTVKKDRDREMRDRDRDYRERLSRSKRRRGDNYLPGSNKEDGGGGGGGGGDDDSSEGSVNDEDEDEDDVRGRYVPPSNHVPVSSSSAASSLTSHRRSYPPPSKVLRVSPTWKAPDEMIGVSIPRKARSASTKRGHDCWSSVNGVTSELNRQHSSSPVRSTMTAAVAEAVTVPPPSPAQPMSPSSSNVSTKKKFKANSNGLKQRPPKSSKASPLIQDEIEIEVAEVLYGLMRQSQVPSKQDGLSNDNNKVDFRSSVDCKSGVSSPVHNNNNNISKPLTTVAPKRKRPRQFSDENLGPATRNSPIISGTKGEADQLEINPAVENGNELLSSQDLKAAAACENDVLSIEKEGLVEESGEIASKIVTKVEEASSSPKLESPQNDHRVESSTTPTKRYSCGNEIDVEQKNQREEKIEIDLMAPPQESPGREEEMAEYGGGDDEKSMVTDKDAEGKASIKSEEDNDDNKGNKSRGAGIVEFNTTTEAVDGKQLLNREVPTSKPNLDVNVVGKNNNSDTSTQLDVNVNEKLNFQKQQQPAPPKTITSRDDVIADNKPGGCQSGSATLPLSVAGGGWHGGLAPMGYGGPLQGVVSIDGTPMPSPPIQPPHFLFSQPKPKRCATHCYVARSISVHQQMMKMNPFWPAAAAGTAPLFGAKPYNLNMVPPADLHAAGRGVAVNTSQDNKGQPFTFFPGQPPASSKDKSPQTPTATDAAQKQFLLQTALAPAAPGNILHAPALFFPMGQQQAAVQNVRSGSAKLQYTPGTAASNSTPTSAPMGAAGTTSSAGPAMSFSYPSMGGNETQFMAILGNSGYPFPISAHVGAAPPYRGTHPQAMQFFNGSFYSSQMLHHHSQLQQQQASQSMQIQQQNQPNHSISTASSSSQKHLQSQQLRPQGSSIAGGTTSNQGGSQNFHAAKGRTSHLHHDMGGEDSPSTADSRTQQNMSVYGQNFAMPFNSPNFGLMTSSSAKGGSGNNAAGVPIVNLDEKKQQQAQQSTTTFPMSFATNNGATTPGLDMSTMAHNHAVMQSLPEAARQNYHLMTNAAVAQAAQHKKNSYRSVDDGKMITDTSNIDEERKAMAMKASAASGGQSIAFSRDLGDKSISTMPGNNVVDSSARSLNLVHGSSARPSRSPGQNSNASNSQQQMFPSKQPQYVTAPGAVCGRSKTPTPSNGNVYSDYVNSPSIMAAKFPNTVSGFPPLVQTSVAPNHTQWKNSVRPNASQVSSQSVATSTASNMKNLPQQPGRSQQNHTQISFGPTGGNPKASISQGQHTQSNSQAPSSPMVVRSPSTSSVSKGASGSPRTTTSASTGSKVGAQGSTLQAQQGKTSHTMSLSSQKQAILGSPHHIMSPSSNLGGKPQMQQSQLYSQLSKQDLQQAQLYFSNFMQQAFASTSAAMHGDGGYHLQRQPDTSQQQQGPRAKSQGSSGPVTSSSSMLSLCSPVSDPAKAMAAAANGKKGSLQSQGMLHAPPQSSGGAHQLMPAGFPYAHAVSTPVQVKPAEQKQPADDELQI